MRKVLKILPVEVRKSIRIEILLAGEDMAQTIRHLAPYAHLDAATKVTPGDQALALYEKQKSRRLERDPYLAAVVHVDAFDAAWVEFGTPPHENLGIYPGTLNPGTRARPYFWPGYRSRKKDVLRRINNAARKGIRQGTRTA